MEKVDEFIQEYTRNCSNKWYDDLSQGYEPWLTPNQARKAVEIAREETIKEVCEWLNSHYRDYMYNPTGKQLEAFFGMDMVEDLKKHLKGNS